MPKGHLPVVSYLAVPVISQSRRGAWRSFFGHDKPAAFGKEAEEIVKRRWQRMRRAPSTMRACCERPAAKLPNAAGAEERHRRKTEGLNERRGAAAGGPCRRARSWPSNGTPAQTCPIAARTPRKFSVSRVVASPVVLGDFLAAVHPHDRPHVKALMSSLRPDSPSYAIDFRYIRPDGREVWLEGDGKRRVRCGWMLRAAQGLTRDITEHKRAQEHQSLLIAELDHRVKNVLSCVAVRSCSATRESSGSVLEFTDALTRRLHSMATHPCPVEPRSLAGSQPRRTRGWRTGPMAYGTEPRRSRDRRCSLQPKRRGRWRWCCTNSQLTLPNMVRFDGAGPRVRTLALRLERQRVDGRFSWSGRRRVVPRWSRRRPRLWHQRDLRPDPL